MTDKIDISIVIPAYNERNRLPHFLKQIISHCKRSQKKYEIIIVDDGSQDETFHVALSFVSQYQHLQVLKNKRNRGKGYSVKRGFLRSKGNLCLFLDADGSVTPDEIERNIPYIEKDGFDIFVGSRTLKDKNQSLKVKWYRKAIGTVFNFLVQSLLFKNIGDTQCGFKIFRREVIIPLFSRVYLEGFGFDIEVLYLAHKMGYRVKEGPVSWHHVGGSKINLATDSFRMFWNILQVRNWHCTPINPLSQWLGPDEYQYMYNMENLHWWFISRRYLMHRLLKSLKLISPYILDVGSGTGANLIALQRIGRTYGIDASQKALNLSKRRGQMNITQGLAERLPYKERSFDLITCLDILEHTHDPVKALKEIRRVLKDNGRILIMVPAFRLLWSQHDEALCHYRRYNKISLSNDLFEAGFKIEKMSYLFFLSFFAVAPIRIIRRLLFTFHKPQSDTTTLPPKYLNDLLIYIFKKESGISAKMGLPFGTTLFAIATKQSGYNQATYT